MVAVVVGGVLGAVSEDNEGGKAIVKLQYDEILVCFGIHSRFPCRRVIILVPSRYDLLVVKFSTYCLRH
jgi:hypothetical protein